MDKGIVFRKKQSKIWKDVGGIFAFLHVGRTVNEEVRR